MTDVDLSPHPDTSDASRCAALLTQVKALTAENKRLREARAAIQASERVSANAAETFHADLIATRARLATVEARERALWDAATTAREILHGLEADGFTPKAHVITMLTCAMAALGAVLLAAREEAP